MGQGGGIYISRRARPSAHLPVVDEDAGVPLQGRDFLDRRRQVAPVQMERRSRQCLLRADAGHVPFGRRRHRRQRAANHLPHDGRGLERGRGRGGVA